MLEESRKQELNQYMVKEQNPADFFNEQINNENFRNNFYWAQYENKRSYIGRGDFVEAEGWKLHIHADNDADWQKIASVLIPYFKDNDTLFKTFGVVEGVKLFDYVKESPNLKFIAERKFYDKDENQYGKAFTIYPYSKEEFVKLAREIDYILENNNLNNHQGFIHGDNQIGNHGRIFYRNEWTGPNNPSYRENARNELPSYKAEGIEDPFLNVLGYPNDNTNAEKAAGTHGPRKLVENRLAKLKEAEERIAREQAEREALKQQQAEKEVVEEVELKAVEVPVVAVQNEEVPVKKAQTERAKVAEVQKQPTLNEAIKFSSNKKAKKNATLEDIVANYEVLKQKDVPEGERRTVKKEMEQLQSLAQTKMDEAIVHIAKLKKNNEAPSVEEVASLNNLLAGFDDKEVGAYLPSIRKLRSQLEEFQPAKETPKILVEEPSKDVVEKSETKKEEAKEGKHYSKEDLEKIVSTFKGMVERSDGNGTSFESLFEYSVQDLKDYNDGKLTIDTDAKDVMKEFINIFATDSKGNLSEEGQKALAKLGADMPKNGKDAVAEVVEPEVGTAIPVVEAKVAEPEVDTAIPVIETQIVEPEVVVPQKEDIEVVEIPEFKPQQKTKVAATTLDDKLKAQGIDLSSPDFRIVKKEITPKKSRWQKFKESVKNIFVPIPAYQAIERGEFANGDTYSRSFTVPEKKSLLSRMGNKMKVVALGIATIAAVAFGLNKCSDDKQKVEPKEKDKTEVKAQTQKIVAPSQQNKVLAVHAGDIEKAYYDSAIEMQIGAKKRDNLYGIIEKRVKNNELDIGAFSVERAVHAMVMYQKIQPNNEINKVFNKVVNGDELSKIENARIKKSVQEAGEYGDGVKGKGKHNQFEHASKPRQVEHMKALKAMRDR